MKASRACAGALLATCLCASVAAAKDLEIVVDSDPSGARVEMNGNTMCVTPCRRMYPKGYFDSPNTIFTKYLAESVVLTLSKDGYYTKTVEITHGPFLWRSFNGANSFIYYLLEPYYLIHLGKIEDQTPSTPPSAQATISHGTAFQVVAPGYLVTNFHVVEGASTLAVERKRARCNAALVASDRANDLAILYVESECLATLHLAEPLRLGASAALVAGADVVTYGYPLPQEFGAEPQVSKGIVKSMSGLEGDARTLTISNTIQPGSSGGPLFTPEGQVIGVVTATMNVNYLYPRYKAIPQELSFAVKSEYVRLLFEVSGILRQDQASMQTPTSVSVPASPRQPSAQSSPPRSPLETVEMNLLLVSAVSE